MFLEARGLKVGIINGASGQRNQETIKRFWKTPPECHVIVSTEAGSEGVNLQVANVLVNYDLPWNPMIVEQRIGRVQRLASEHASVSILNIILKDTFEEYIVGRLMEKLQMAAHAIGDLEALLEASGIDDEGGEDSTTRSCAWCWRRSPARTSKRPRARLKRASSRQRPSCKRKKPTSTTCWAAWRAPNMLDRARPSFRRWCARWSRVNSRWLR